MAHIATNMRFFLEIEIMNQKIIEKETVIFDDKVGKRGQTEGMKVLRKRS